MSALSDEIANDPTGRGYATPLAAGDHQEVARLLNEPITDLWRSNDTAPWPPFDVSVLEAQ